MRETEGVYSEVQLKMQEDGEKDWVIKSRLAITSDFGECRFLLDFYEDKRVYIIAYIPCPSTDVYYSMDLRCLTQWCQAMGWEIPRPTESLVKENLSLWKHMWNTLLVDSEYLDKRFGIRAALDTRTIQPDPDDELDMELMPPIEEDV
jgi:hypothetical protein